MSVLALSKDQLRSKYLKLRKELSRDFAEKRSRLIAQKVLSLEEMASAKVVSAYLAINNEVEARLIIDQLLKSGVKILVPKYLTDNDQYAFVAFGSWKELMKGPFGIDEPTEATPADPATIEVAIIPGLVFDRSGWRLGYGKGVFDRLLAGPKAVKIALAFELQIVDQIPYDKNDLRMDLIVTEKEIYRF